MLGRWVLVGLFYFSLLLIIGGVELAQVDTAPAVEQTQFAVTKSVAPEPIVAPEQPSKAATTVAKVESSVTPEPKASVVVPTVPTIAVPQLGYSVTLGNMRAGKQINPPNFGQAFSLTDIGVLPSAGATDTTFVACHTHSRRSAAVVPCNNLPGKVEPGFRVVITTESGEVLTYVVREQRKILRDDLASDPSFWAVRPGQLSWVMCYINSKGRTEFNYVIVADLYKG